MPVATQRENASVHAKPVDTIDRLRRGALLAGPSLLWGCSAAPTLGPGAQESPRPDWQPLLLPGKRATAYRRGKVDGRDAWHARADAAASLLRRPLSTPVTATTTAEFSWRIAGTIVGADLRKADAADSPVRVAFAFAGDVSKLPTRTRMQFHLAEALTGEMPPYATLMYVWDNHAEVDSVLTGPRSERVRNLVLESGPAHVGQWRHYRRPLAADFRRAFGEPPGRLMAVAIMTDSDNTGGHAEAWYGDVVLRT